MKSELEVREYLEGLEGDLRQVAYSVVGASTDALGADAGDYMNEMRIVAWLALQRSSDASYVFKSIWNKSRELSRRARRFAAVKAEVPVGNTAYELNLDKMVDVQNVWIQTPESDRRLIMDYIGGVSFRAMAPRYGVSDWTVRSWYRDAVEPFRGL